MAYSRKNSTLSQAFRLFSKWAEAPITAVPAAEISQTQSRIPPFDWASLTSTDNSTFNGETAPSESTGARAAVSGFISLSNSEGGGNPLERSTTILSDTAAMRHRLEALENNFYAANGIFLRQCSRGGTLHDGNHWPANYQDQHRARQTRTKIVRRSQQ